MSPAARWPVGVPGLDELFRVSANGGTGDLHAKIPGRFSGTKHRSRRQSHPQSITSHSCKVTLNTAFSPDVCDHPQ